jgi:glycosyltransferase involved in cell wall biosynthesis
MADAFPFGGMMLDCLRMTIEKISEGRALRLCAVVMIRNEADLCRSFLTQCVTLFDRVWLVDHQSTDGTRDIIDEFARRTEKFEIYRYAYLALYQAQVITLLARMAFEQGADWVFPLDADEFIDMPDRLTLEAYLKSFQCDVMSMRWANLVPDDPGSFDAFDASQAFRWSGRLSNYQKVAIAAPFAVKYPDFFIHSGNHDVSPTKTEPRAKALRGPDLLHVPIRARDRLFYKASMHVAAHKARHGRPPYEGFHIFEILEMLQSREVTGEWLNGLIASYSEPIASVQPVDPILQNWAVKRIPGTKPDYKAERAALDLKQTVTADAQRSWIEIEPIDPALVLAEPRGQEIMLRRA